MPEPATTREVRCPACGFHTAVVDHFDAAAACPNCGAPIPMTTCVPSNDFDDASSLQADASRAASDLRRGPGEAVLWCLAFVVVLQLIPSFIGGYIAARATHAIFPQMDPRWYPETPQYAQALLPWMAICQAASIAIAHVAARWTIGPSWTGRIGLRAPKPLHLLLAVLSLPGIMILAIGVDGLAKQLLPQVFDIEGFIRMTTLWPWVAAVFVIGVGPGIGEEMWFRGFIGRGLIGRFGSVAGVLLTSLLFGLAHLEPRQVVSAFAMGLLLHLAYLASRSLWIPIFLHIANNSVSVLTVRSPKLEFLNTSAEQIPLAFYLAAATFTALNAWAFYRTRVREPGEPESPVNSRVVDL